MFTSRPGKMAYFDVDDTLLEWRACDKDDINAIKLKNNGHTFYRRAVGANIDGLKDHANAGHIVVVWSQGGVEWATTVVHALGLEKYVDIVLTKPDWYYDDKHVKDWFPKRQFKK